MTDGSTRGLLAFRIGEAPAALPLKLVREVVASPGYVPIPGCRNHVAGVALHGGLAVPVYDLRRFDGLWSDPPRTPIVDDRNDASHMIVCDWGEALVGLLGEGVDLLDAPEEEIGGGRTAVPWRGEYLIGFTRRGEEVVAVLDAAVLFPSLGVPDPAVTVAREDAGEKDSSGR